MDSPRATPVRGVTSLASIPLWLWINSVKRLYLRNDTFEYFRIAACVPCFNVSRNSYDSALTLECLLHRRHRWSRR